jgi:hypothetical protein
MKSFTETLINLFKPDKSPIEVLEQSALDSIPDYPIGWNAMGKPVPANRVQRTYRHLQEMCPSFTKEECYTIVAKIGRMIEKDEPNQIIGQVAGLDKDLDKVDLTGRYVLLAFILNDK